MLSPVRVRTLSWLLLGLVATAALVFGTIDNDGPSSNAERAAAVAATVACPECDGQPVSDSNAPIAEIIRTEIKKQVDAGLTDAQIRQVYVDQYGEWVDLSPSRSGLTGVVWIAPFLVVGLAVGALAIAFSRWSGSTSDQVASDEDHQLVQAAQSRAGASGPSPLEPDASDTQGSPPQAGDT
jgi:cytochrome c-type biogenesis protein CcmH/NrfF